MPDVDIDELVARILEDAGHDVAVIVGPTGADVIPYNTWAIHHPNAPRGFGTLAIAGEPMWATPTEWSPTTRRDRWAR